MTINIPRLPTIKDLEINGKKILMRIDINSPIDPETEEIMDDKRISVHGKHVKEILEKYNPAIILISHQGRPGESDFISLEKHSLLLSKYMGIPVKFVDDIIGPKAREEIRELKPGEVLLLENLRILSEEIIEAAPEKQALTMLVKKLSSNVDVYVNDAFATAHRSQPSIVGFPLSLPSCIGPVFEKEIQAITRILDSFESPRIYVLGVPRLESYSESWKT